LDLFFYIPKHLAHIDAALRGRAELLPDESAKEEHFSLIRLGIDVAI
jgi:hypothetical protein